MDLVNGEKAAGAHLGDLRMSVTRCKMKWCPSAILYDVDIRLVRQENLNAMDRLYEENASDSHPGDLFVSLPRCVVKWSISFFVGGIDTRPAGQKFLQTHNSGDRERVY